MKTWIHRCLATSALVLLTQQAAAVNIEIDYSFDSIGFFSTPVRKDVLDAASKFFEGVIGDDLTAITSSGTNHFDAEVSRPDTGINETITDFSVAADTLIVYAGGRALSGALGRGGPGGFSLRGTADFIDNAVSRGELADTQDATATDFAPWGGSLTFDTGSNWYFDSDTSSTETFAGNDFYSVALHELGHLFGLGTADSWFNLINTNLEFTGVAAAAEFGGLIPLANTGHWESGITSTVNGMLQEAAMDPDLTVGTRKVFTDLDVAALTDVGWEITVVPIPAAIWLFSAGFISLLGVGVRPR
jgi:hypothetical protein